MGFGEELLVEEGFLVILACISILLFVDHDIVSIRSVYFHPLSIS